MPQKIIYLDNAATTKIDEKVMRAMLPFLKENYGNPSSKHSLGRAASLEIENARNIIAKSINASPEEIFFTSGGTEANNLALKGLFFESQKQNSGKNHIITTKIEHDSILKVCKWLEKNGARVTYLNVDKNGFLDLEQLKKEITSQTLVVSIIHGNNEIGTLQDLEEIGRICEEKKVYLHSDSCQSYLKSDLDVKKQNISLLTLNAHKIHGPKGIGALFIKKGVKLTPLLHGGGHEKGMRSGTENTSGIVGFGEAVKIYKKSDNKKISKLRDYFINHLLKIDKTKLNGPQGTKRLCNNISLSLENIEGEAIQSLLEEYRIFISTGSACASNTLEKSHVLRAIGANDFEINSSIRISLSKFTTKQEIDYFILKFKDIIKKLRGRSPFN